MALSSPKPEVAFFRFSKYLATLYLTVVFAACFVGSGPPPEAVLPDETSAAGININTAGERELQELEGIGPKTAEKIIDHRRRFGRFRKPADIMLVEGIGEKQFVKFRGRIRIK